MAAQLFNRIGQIGLGLALTGGVINSALYNGKSVDRQRNLSKTEDHVGQSGIRYDSLMKSSHFF